MTSQESYRFEPQRRDMPSEETIACARRLVNGVDRALNGPLDAEMLLAIVLNLRVSLLLLTGSSEVEIHPQPQPWYSM